MKLIDLLRAIGLTLLPILSKWLEGVLCPDCARKVRAELDDTPPARRG